MADNKTDQEPSIEEILESIRQIISEDGTPVETVSIPPPAPPKPVAPPPPVVAKPPLAPEPEEAYTPPPAPKAAPVPPPAPKIPPMQDLPPLPRLGDEETGVVLDLTDKIETPKPESRQNPRIVLEDVMEDEEHLVSDMTADAAVAAMMKLLSNNISLERELPGKPGPVTLEDMARELMRPLIKQWLDRNLQHIIEKMVAREIERLSARALDQ